MQNLTNAKLLFRYEASFQVSSEFESISATGRILEYSSNSETRVKLLGDPMKMCVTWTLKSKQLDFDNWSRFYTKERESYANLQTGVLYLQIV